MFKATTRTDLKFNRNIVPLVLYGRSFIHHLRFPILIFQKTEIFEKIFRSFQGDS